jgi:pSer/pThr/pTyr-binding forkhead associated (FHA) protein
MANPLVIVHVPLPAQEVSDFMFDYVFDRPQICLIGRTEDCDIRILEGIGQREIASHHCLLEIEPPLARLYDLGSDSGTYVNGARLQPISDPTDLPHSAAVELKDGDEIRVGDTALHVKVGADSDITESSESVVA